MIHMRRTGVFILLALALLGGCAKAPTISPQEQTIRATITRYNELLIQGYRSLNMNPMQEVATKLQSEDEYIYMSSLAEGGVRLDPELKKQEFVRVSIEATSATAETRETWDYRHYNRTSGKLLLEQKALVYVLAWDLEKQSDGRWLVSDVRAIEATTSSPASVLGSGTPGPMGH